MVDDWELFVKAVGLLYILKWMIVVGKWIIYKELEAFVWIVTTIKVEWILFRMKVEEEMKKIR